MKMAYSKSQGNFMMNMTSPSGFKSPSLIATRIQTAIRNNQNGNTPNPGPSALSGRSATSYSQSQLAMGNSTQQKI